MKHLPALLCVVSFATPAVSSRGSFYRDVAGARGSNVENQATLVRTRQQERQQAMTDAILAKAVPYADYLAQLAELGGVAVAPVQPDDNGPLSRRRMDENGNDDFFNLDDNALYSFSGFSLKYTQCQPVNYFSQDAVEAGEHSPMMTQDIVVLRLCPLSSCVESAEYGCHYNFAEYALSLEEYLDIMLRFSYKQRDALCNWCETCQARRRNEEEAGEEDGAEEEDEEPEEEEEDQAQNDAGNDYAASDCTDSDTYCYNYNYVCNEEADDDSNAYVDYEQYMDYLECTAANYNNHAFYVRPRCNADKGIIEMAVYYDNYCSQLSSEYNVKDLGLGLKEGFFKDFYSGKCIDCSESNYPPYFNYGSGLCNNIHYISAKCTNDLTYDIFDGAESDSSECSFIETIRFGTYDSTGNVVTGVSYYSGWTAKVSTSQKILLALSIFASVTFVIYACYLHHAMTNLLIKSLSHRELLPPSRQNRRRSPGSSRRGSRLLDSEPTVE